MQTQSKNASGTTASLLLTALLFASPAWAQECEVKIGVVGPMSGGAAQWGLAAKAGAEFAAAMANLDGGLPMGNRKCRVKVISFDALYTAAGGAAAANSLANDGVRVVIGPVGSPENAGFRTVAKRYGQISFNTSYMEGAISPEYPLAFHALQSPITWGPLAVKAAKEQFKFTSALVIAPNDQAGTDAAKQLNKMYSDLGVKSSEEFYQRGTTNFGPLAIRVLNANPGTVEMTSVPPGDAISIAKQLAEAGYKGYVGSLGGSGPMPIIQAFGGLDKVKGLYWLDISPASHPGIVKMRADFQRVMKVPAPEPALFSTVALAAEVALNAISRAGTDQDGEKIADVLRKSTPESRYVGKAGWRGKTLYGINQELTFPVGMGMVIDGKMAPARTIEIPTE